MMQCAKLWHTCVPSMMVSVSSWIMLSDFLSCDTIAHPTDVSQVVPHPHTPLLYFPPLCDACLQAVPLWRYGRAEWLRVTSSASDHLKLIVSCPLGFQVVMESANGVRMHADLAHTCSPKCGKQIVCMLTNASKVQ